MAKQICLNLFKKWMKQKNIGKKHTSLSNESGNCNRLTAFVREHA